MGYHRTAPYLVGRVDLRSFVRDARLRTGLVVHGWNVACVQKMVEHVGAPQVRAEKGDGINMVHMHASKGFMPSAQET